MLSAVVTGFLDEATEIARVRRGTMLGRDSELRRVWWAITAKDPALGDRGQEIAAAMAGPGDMVSEWSLSFTFPAVCHLSFLVASGLSWCLVLTTRDTVC